MLSNQAVESLSEAIMINEESHGKTCMEVLKETLAEFNLDQESLDNFFGFLVNGEKADGDFVLSDKDKLEVVVMFAGGK